MKNNRILVVSGFVPYPTYFGGAFDIFERIKGLKKLGFHIDLICTSKQTPSENDISHIKEFVDNLFVTKRKNSLSGLFSLKPLQVVSRDSLRNINLSHQVYDTVILESESVSSILKNKSLRCNKIILRAHNNETKYFKELYKSTPNALKKLYYISESIKFRMHSSAMFEKADKLWFISNDECKQNIRYSQKSIHLPAPINMEFRTRELQGKKVLFIGSLFMPNNIEAIDWYLNNVHPKLLDIEGYKFILVGSTGNLSSNSFEIKYGHYPKVELHCNQKDLECFYKESSIFVNPMIHGTGVKLKTINALVNGLPIVSTKVGAEGIDLIKDEMYFEATSSVEFVKAIKYVMNLEPDEKRAVVLKGQKFLADGNYLKVLYDELVQNN